LLVGEWLDRNAAYDKHSDRISLPKERHAKVRTKAATESRATRSPGRRERRQSAQAYAPAARVRPPPRVPAEM
jgi:hypothetical protein